MLVTLNIGALDISLKDLWALRKGFKIALERPPVFDAALQVDGVNWACGKLQFVGEQLEIIITELPFSGSEEQPQKNCQG